ncbi:MAG TPA: glutamate--tRNA ligase [Hyphomonadaceae bacterium]|nr:glutamate--tRNA ligase [Hyphomonadaceae bacterium]HPN07258.1 glutamate--tRNA ligase [Hyphomonadaceae bacterium]
MTVVTRFAPSPTGYLHIGGARTALFSWLYARAKGGKFLLRIEDTDKERSTQEAIDAILDGLNWLGLGGDEPAILQSSRIARHAQVAHELVQRGAAYHCPVTPEELQQRRDAAELLQKKKAADGSLSTDDAAKLDELTRPFRSPWRDPAKPLPPSAATVVRLRMPDTGELTVADHVQGTVSRKFADLDDLVLLRSDGTPTYMLAVVVDDHDMGVTHVIRGDDHFLNTFRQLPIYLGMGWPQPEYSHVPLIHGQDGKKLSKRHGATAVDEYRDVLGYLPEGMKNYLLRLGWSHGDDEIIPEAKAIEWFDLDGLNKAPARLDFAKLDSVNKHYMAEAPEAALFDLLLQRPEMQGQSPDVMGRIQAALPVLKGRAANIVQLAEQVRFLTDIRPITLTGKAADQVNDEARARLKALSPQLRELADWSEASIKSELTRFCDQNGISLGKIGPVLRAVLTGGAPAPDIALVLALLGRNEAFARLSDYAAAGG